MKVQIQKLIQVKAAKELEPLIGLIMTFSLEDMHLLQTPHSDASLIQLKITTAILQRILIDIRSSLDILILTWFKKLQFDEKDLEVVETPIVGSKDEQCHH